MRYQSLEITTWGEIKGKVRKVNPQFADWVDAIDGADHFRLLRVKYRFGDLVVKSGKFYLRLDGELVPFESEVIPDAIKKLFNYYWRTLPFGMVLNGCMEPMQKYEIFKYPCRAIVRGDFFSLLTVLENPSTDATISSTYDISVGLRSLITLNKLQDQRGNSYLKQVYDIDQKHCCPQNFDEQWQFLYELVSNSYDKHHWDTDLIFFSYDFLDKKKCANLRSNLLENIWMRSSFLRCFRNYQFLWSSFVNELPKSIGQNQFAVNQSFQVLLCALGVSPAYSPAISDQFAPILFLVQTILDVYKIRYVVPIFLETGNLNDAGIVYYSIKSPFFLHNTPVKSKENEILRVITAIREIMKRFREFLLRWVKRAPIDHNSMLYKNFIQADLQFYHPRINSDWNADINHWVNFDDSFNFYREIGRSRKLSLPINSKFFEGCVRIKNHMKPIDPGGVTKSAYRSQQSIIHT